MAYTKTSWSNNTSPGISADNLDHIETGIEDAHEDISTVATNILAISLKKLWENENPTGDFNTQNITLSSDDYDYLIFFWKQGKNVSRLDSTMILKGYGAYLNMASDYPIGSNNYKVASYVRDVTRVSDTSYTIDTCYARYGDSTTRPTYDANIIPIAIYGGKFLEVDDD